MSTSTHAAFLIRKTQKQECALPVNPCRNPGSQTFELSQHPLPPHGNPLPPHGGTEYEEIQELQTTSSGDHPSSSRIGASTMAPPAYTFTKCPAYGQASMENEAGAVADLSSLPPHRSSHPQAPEYEDIQELQATRNTSPSTSSPSDLEAAYKITKCLAYGQVRRGQAVLDLPSPLPPPNTS